MRAGSLFGAASDLGYRLAVKLAVVIPTLNEAAQIEAAVQSATARDVEIVVVDGRSTDDTRKRARAAGARVVETEPGRARQLAAGARASGGDALLLLHADTRLPPGWDTAVRHALADPKVAGGSFGFRFDRGSPALRFVEFGARLRNVWFRMPYGDQALFVRRAVLEAVGGVPETPIMEDLDLVSAFKRRGRMVLLPLDAVTSARRYEARGPLRTMLRNWIATLAWLLDLDRQRVATWYRG